MRPQPPNLAALRADLVEQVRRNTGVSGAILDALRSVPRHAFLPGVAPEVAYHDDAVVTRRDQEGRPTSSSSQPTIMALMLDQLGVAPGQRVLEIGAGTGYNAALLARLVGPGGEVVSVDLDPEVVDQARANLAGAGGPAVTVVCGDGGDGHPERAPYDRIIATVGVWDLLPSWPAQLAPGGRIVVPLDLRGVQRSVAFESAGDHWASRSVVACGFMRLRGGSAGPERTVVLDRDAELAIMLPDGGELDQAAVLAALATAPARVRTGVRAARAVVLRGLGLWLALREPRWCGLSQLNEPAGPAPLAAAPVRSRGFAMTAGLLDRDGIALLGAGRRRSGADGRPEYEVLALGHGPDGDRLAAELAAHVRDWAATDRAGDAGLRIDAYPRSTPDAELAGRLVVDKTHTRLALSWG